ncbi:MAG TPA: cation-translocating P-type ATPase [Blastocatellia bacterium]|nr:cation-translocating P-type ATPase [Blastocatellia bacterium]
MTDEASTLTMTGLSTTEAAWRLGLDGPNELPSAKRDGILGLVVDVVREPMFLLLVACGAIYLVLGDAREALMLLGFVFLIMGISIYQARKTEHALKALRDLSSPRALIIRNGEQRRIAGREVVRGDILVLSEGDRVPADAVLLSATSLLADESLLTGESVPVRKSSGGAVTTMDRPGGDDSPFVYSGTLIVQGQGIARVEAIGGNTEMGRIGKALQAVKAEETPLQKEIGKLVRNWFVLSLFLCGVIVMVYGVTRNSWLDAFLAGITLAMAILPNEFPVVLTIFLALGAWRISRKEVLTRRMPAVETLGSATVLCVDKTGTLTMNRMSISQLYADGDHHDLRANEAQPLPEVFHALVEFSILASHRDPFDPMEKALLGLGDRYLAQTEHIHNDWVLVREYPLSKSLLALSRVWKSVDGEDYVIASKGAPEAIADLCHFDDARLRNLNLEVIAMAKKGLRVIGVARSGFKKTDLPHHQHDFDFEFLGLVGLDDPVRPTVSRSIRECYQAGIRVIMITGDYPDTAQNVARQIGLQRADEVITGPELDQLSDAGLQARMDGVNIFARVVPEQKLRLVNALKSSGEVVAMTGDGVNDAPALKAAHIGIAMGGRGTDVARESASLVLLNDDFSSIEQAVKLGRRIFDNIKKGMAYILAIHVPIAGMSLFPVFLKLPLVLLPIHIAFLHLIIDPACSIVFEAEPGEPDIMSRPPRSVFTPLFGARTLLLSFFQGASILAILLMVYVGALQLRLRENEARAIAFTTLIVANLGLILTNRSWSGTVVSTLRFPNAALWWVLGCAATLLGLILFIPFLRGLFRFGALTPLDLLICLVAGAVSVLWFEGFKVLRRHV